MSRIRRTNFVVASLVCVGLIFRTVLIELDRGFAIALAGGDAPRFHSLALKGSESLGDAFSLISSGGSLLYAGIVALAYWTVDLRQPEVAKWLNVLASCATLWVTMRCVRHVSTSVQSQTSNKFIVATTWTFAAPVVIYSVLLLRESFVSLLISVGLLFTLRSLEPQSQGREQKWLAASMTATIFASLLHIGSAAFLFYPAYRLVRTSNISPSRLFLLACGIAGLAFSSPLWADKVLVSTGASSITELSAGTVVDASSRFRSGGSAYTVPFSSSGNPVLRLISAGILGPMYFLLTPFPWSVRGVFDVAAGLSGWITFWVITRALWFLKGSRHLFTLAIPLVLFALTFSLATSNAGTAFRHRTKPWPVLVLAYCATNSARTRDDSIELEYPEGIVISGTVDIAVAVEGNPPK